MGSFLRRLSPSRLRERVDALRSRLSGEGRAVPPPRAEVGGPLDAVNDGFHQHYDQARQQSRREGPVFVLLADTLVVFHDEVRAAYSFAPRAFHVIKSVAHAPVALFALVEPSGGAPLPEAVSLQLGALRSQLSEARARFIEEDALEPATRRDCQAVLDATASFLEALLGGEKGAHDLTPFARGLGPTVLRLIRAATALQIDALHQHVEGALAPLSPAERAALHVVVTGDHQARRRSFAMQYFAARLGEPRDVERRLIYAEGVGDERGALALVGTLRFDRTLAAAFFGDAQRMQRDLLGDAAHALLGERTLAPIG